MVFRTHGGKRRGAGRKPNGSRASERHEMRPEHDSRHPVHVTIRIVGNVGGLRRRDIYLALREATIVTAKREDFRIVHMSIHPPYRCTGALADMYRRRSPGTHPSARRRHRPRISGAA